MRDPRHAELTEWAEHERAGAANGRRLTDDNLDLIAGKRDQLSGQIQETYGITKDQAERQLRLFEEIHKNFQPKSRA